MGVLAGVGKSGSWERGRRPDPSTSAVVRVAGERALEHIATVALENKERAQAEEQKAREAQESLASLSNRFTELDTRFAQLSATNVSLDDHKREVGALQGSIATINENFERVQAQLNSKAAEVQEMRAQLGRATQEQLKALEVFVVSVDAAKAKAAQAEERAAEATMRAANAEERARIAEIAAKTPPPPPPPKAPPQYKMQVAERDRNGRAQRVVFAASDGDSYEMIIESRDLNGRAQNIAFQPAKKT